MQIKNGDRVWFILEGQWQQGTVKEYLPDQNKYVILLLDRSQVIIPEDLVSLR